MELFLKKTLDLLLQTILIHVINKNIGYVTKRFKSFDMYKDNWFEKIQLVYDVENTMWKLVQNIGKKKMPNVHALFK